MRYQNLLFFDKKGNPFNFDYDTENEVWTGRIHLPRVSTGLFEVAHVFILEEFLNSASEPISGKPHIDDAAEPNDTITVEWQDTTPEEIFLFQFDPSEETPALEILTGLDVPFDVDPYEFIDSGDPRKVTDLITNESVQLNIAISSLKESLYERILVLRDKNDGLPIAEITVYGETIGEDERLRVVTQNMGYEVLPEDTPIFKKTDVKEAGVDFLEINRKRKEMLLEGHNIKTFTGAYKGLINAIKFFGYDNLIVKEYWRNVDINSPQFGKFKHSKVLDIFDTNVDYNDDQMLLPNKNYRKTSRFGLFYKINEVDESSLDDFGIPEVDDAFEYSLEEALIKLFGLKKKLKDEYLPLNARIIDIVGEADYFTRVGTRLSLSENRADFINAGIETDFTVSPSTIGEIIDLRDIVELELINNSFNPIPHNVFLDDTSFTAAEASDLLLAYFTKYYPNLDTLAELPDKEGIPAGYPIVLENKSFDLTWNEMAVTWNDLNTGVSHVFQFEAENIVIGDVFTITDTISGETVDFIATTTLDTDVAEGLRAAWALKLTLPWLRFLPSVETTPSGDVLRVRGVGTGAQLIDFDFVPSTVNGGGPNLQELNKEVISLSGLYTWENVLRGNFYEMEWTISKPETETPAFFFTIRGPVGELDLLPISLPYVGKYDVEMRLYDTFNQISSEFRDEYIEVESREVEFMGFYKFREKEYTWITKDENLDWNNYDSYWDLPFLPNIEIGDAAGSLYEALDRANAIVDGIESGDPNFHIQNYQNSGGISYAGPYFWNNLEEGNWDDAFHIWWDGVNISGDTPAHFDIEIVQETGSLFINDGNTVVEHVFGSSDHQIVAAELNASTDPIIAKYIYNPVSDEFDVSQYIHAVGKFNGKTCDFVDVTGTTGAIVISNKGDSVTNNFTFNDINVLNNGKILPRLVHVTFTYDKSKIPGKTNPRWIIRNTTDPNVEDVTFTGRWMNYLFKQNGSFTIILTLDDSNGNEKTVEKNIIIIE